MKKEKFRKLLVTGTIRRRLLDLGLIRGTKIVPVLISPSKDPRAFEVRGSLIAIRKEDANNIIIEWVKKKGLRTILLYFINSLLFIILHSQHKII